MLDNYSLLSIIPSVYALIVFEKKLFISDINKSIYYLDVDNNKVIIIEGITQFTPLSVIGQFLFFESELSDKLLYFNLEIEKLESYEVSKTDFYFVSPNFKYNPYYIIAYLYNNPEKLILKAINLIDKKISTTFEGTFSSPYITENIVFGSTKKEEKICWVLSSDKHTGKLLWEADLGEFDWVRKILGQVDNTLWLWCGEYTYVGLDVHTGKVTSHWLPMEVDGKTFYFKWPYFNEHNGNVYYFEGQHYAEINLRTQTTTILWESDIGFIFEAPNFIGDKVYFSASRKERRMSNFIGVFNTINKEIEWLHKETFADKFSFFCRPPQVYNNKIYAIDCNWLLRIYERDE